MTKFLPVALLLLLAASMATATPVDQLGTYRFSVTVQGHTLKIPYDANQSITVAHSSVRRLVLLIHGSSRHSDTALETLQLDATAAGVNNSSSLLVGPQFLTEEDIDDHALASDMLFWEDDGWKQGDQSLSTTANARPAKISAFAVLDSMLYRIATLCPNLETIVIGGHSAGGQFTNRFAAGSRLPQLLAQQFGIQMSYVVANPSSYIYMDGTRLVPKTSNSWATPQGTSCPEYNFYKYGMQSRNPYMAAVSSAQIASQYAQRRVTYLLGELDTDPNGDGVDTDCPAEIQGSYRLERGLTYRKYLIHYYGPEIQALHEAITVPGVGHDSQGMFTSTCGLSRLFGFGSCSTIVGVEGGAPTHTSALQHGQLSCSPNPIQGRATISFAVPNGQGPATVSVFDVRGRLVRAFTTDMSGGKGSLVWDGRSGSGQDLSSGIYYVRLQHAGGTLKTAVVLLK
jgi:hypothetical protein